METYPHSKISPFENCHYQYKLRYIIKDFRLSLSKRKDAEEE